mgnify:CR=1 FL=1
MKNQVLGIFFYLLYLLAMVRPLVPIIEYHANYDYIATVLCENKDKPYLECSNFFTFIRSFNFNFLPVKLQDYERIK